MVWADVYAQDTREKEVTVVSMKKDDWRNRLSYVTEWHIKIFQLFIRKVSAEGSNTTLHEHQPYYDQIFE